MASPGSDEVRLNGEAYNRTEYEPVDSDIGEGSGVLKPSDRDPVDLPFGPGGRSVL